uniref:Uncharacterized protein n=1 Tax=Syphacia muris TaxID=451379 RepID=A0A0N5AZQ9_9BILA
MKRNKDARNEEKSIETIVMGKMKFKVKVNEPRNEMQLSNDKQKLTQHTTIRFSGCDFQDLNTAKSEFFLKIIRRNENYAELRLHLLLQVQKR